MRNFRLNDMFVFIDSPNSFVFSHYSLEVAVFLKNISNLLPTIIMSCQKVTPRPCTAIISIRTPDMCGLLGLAAANFWQ